MKKEEAIKELLLLCSEKFYDIERYQITDQSVKMLFERWPENASEAQVLTKVVVLKSLYYTALYNVHAMARHIVKQEIDSKLAQGDITVIYDIRKGHGIFRGKTKKDWDFYSFATKYCHWHAPSNYVMYDTFVDTALKDLNERLGFYSSFSSAKLRQEYSTLKKVIDSLASALGLTNLDYKKLDQALWIYGKYLRNDLRDDIEVNWIESCFRKIALASVQEDKP